MTEKVLSFNIWGEYAHFKKYYTTTSPLTFEFPPPTTIFGIISAIIGLDKNEYLNFFENENDFKIAVIIKSPVTKVRWTQNLIKTSVSPDNGRAFWKIRERTQIRTEFLKNPCFKIYFSHKNDEIYKTLKAHLENHTSVYSVSLGLSELLGNFDYNGEVQIVKVSADEKVNVNSVIPCSKLTEDKSVDFNRNVEIFKVNYPVIMDTERVVTKRENVIFERKCQQIICKVQEYYSTESGENIVFF